MGGRVLPEPPRYPEYVRTESERTRWDVSREAAAVVARGLGGDEFTVLLATRSLYESDIATFDDQTL